MSAPIKNDWLLLEEFRKSNQVKDFIDYKIPFSQLIEFQSKNIYCKHIDVRKRKCLGSAQCPVKYKIIKCFEFKTFKIYFKNHHNHRIEENYDNTNGIRKEIKEIITDLMNNGINQLRTIQSFLIENQKKLQDLELP